MASEKTNLLIGGVAVLALGASMFTIGQNASSEPTAPIAVQASVDNAGIFVTGEGKISVTPDVLEFYGSVTYKADQAKAALDYTSVIVEKLQKELAKYGVKDKDIQTSNISVYPNYNYSKGQSYIDGYEASNALTVKLRDLDKAGEVLSALQKVGGNDLSIDNVSFTVDDPEGALDEAREKAVEDARQNAEIFAKASGQKVGAVIYISDSTSGVDAGQYIESRFTLDSGYDSRYEQDVPVSPGSQDITVNVEVRYAIS